MIAWSYGGGVQSVAIGVLIGEGALPVPDLAGIADTSRERRTTWDYLRDHMQPYLDRKGVSLKIEVVPHSLSRVDLYAKDGLTLVPAYTRTVSLINTLFGEDARVIDGRLPPYCSGEWKRDTMLRWYRSKGVEQCVQWIGYSTDERRRVGPDRQKWCASAYPLIERGISRDMCARIIEGAGLPLPRKSRCWCCPHQTAEEWQEVRADPQEWAAAVRLEQEINESDPQQAGLFLYSGRVPLPLADFATDVGTLTPSKPCEMGHCWT